MDRSSDPRFACDAMLGGLARWLRAAGYDASWTAGIPDPALVRQAQAEGRMILTSDTDILQYAVVRDGVVPMLFVPLGLGIQEQLGFVLQRLGLALREPRCMACGGSLVERQRTEVTDRVPPRSLERQEQFWECRRCRQVFWHGTHWERIVERLRAAVAPPRP
jgi:uncharacterized protein with PIN domain